MNSSNLIHILAAIATTGLLLSTKTYADGAKLKIHVANAKQSSNYFLCIGNEGCINVSTATKNNKAFPLTPGKINQAFVLNSNNLRIYKQALPDSCQVAVSDDQTLQVNGKITTKTNGDVALDDFSCKVVG